MACSQYWSARHNSKLDSVEHVFNVAEKLARRPPPPWQRARRGRRPKFSARRHAAICVAGQYFDHTLREVEGQSPHFVGRAIDHSTVGWAFKRLRANYLKLLLVLLRRELARLFKCEFYVADSTETSTPRLATGLYRLRKTREREFYKLHALVGYSSEARALVVVSARVTKSNAHDSTQLVYLLKGLDGGGAPLLADRGYDSRENMEVSREHNFDPVIKPRSFGSDGRARRKLMREFRRRRRLYRRRGIAEALFGGLENRYRAQTRCKRARTKETSMLLMLVAHNIRTLMRVRTSEKGDFLFIMGIYSTNPPEPAVLHNSEMGGLHKLYR